MSQTQVEVQNPRSIELVADAAAEFVDTATSLLNNCNISAEHPIKSSLSTEIKDFTNSPFPLSNLPVELRHEIYAHYFAALPSQHITCTASADYKHQTAKQTQAAPTTTTSDSPAPITHPPFHLLPSLSQISPSPDFAIPPSLYYTHTTFSFTCPSALKSFTLSPLPRNHVRSIRIEYGRINRLGQGPDWVFLMLGGFERLESVVFVVESGCGCCGMVVHERDGGDGEADGDKGETEGKGKEKEWEGWWKCVEDAVREGIAAEEKGKGRGLKLSLEVKRGKECFLVEQGG